ncbi:MAG: hypothetical protein INR73_15915 [Williamsia sp.]|nr:hypothetical protein [Williamsia sp.]
MNSRYYRRALQAGLIVGTFDITAACIQYYARTGKDPLVVMKYVASGLLGKDAMTGGAGAIIAGTIFHYFIATCWTLLFFWLYARIPALSKSRLISGILYGIFVSLIMQAIVVPLSRVARPPFTVTGSATAALIIVICVGIPLAYLASRAMTHTAFHKIEAA